MSAKWESKNKTGAIRPRFSFANWQEREDSNPRPLVLESSGRHACLLPEVRNQTNLSTYPNLSHA